MPQWVIDQLTTRSLKTAMNARDNDNLKYLANKTAWVRLVSSVDINGDDINYFRTKIPGGVSDPSDLAKKFVLFGGTSKYLNPEGNPRYELRSGINEGSYGMLGKDETRRYGYRPMPGINSVNIETQGRLGSVRQAVISFKCWDKMQLDIIDAIYFKLGYTMFLEWGHTYYYPSVGKNFLSDSNQTKLLSSELQIIDPFQSGLTKEKIFRQIAQNSRQSDGNYDAMLGIVTNFNFSYNQEGGYDCTLRLMSLGYLSDTIKINNPSILPNLLKDEILLLKSTLDFSSTNDEEALASIRAAEEEKAKELSKIKTIPEYIVDDFYLSSESQGDAITELIAQGKYATLDAERDRKAKSIEGVQSTRKFYPGRIYPKEYRDVISDLGVLNSAFNTQTAKFQDFDFIYDDGNGYALYSQKYNIKVPEDNIKNYVDFIQLDETLLSDKINTETLKFFTFKKAKDTSAVYDRENILIEDLNTIDQFKYPSKINFFIYYKNKAGDSKPDYILSIDLDLNQEIIQFSSEDAGKIRSIKIEGTTYTIKTEAEYFDALKTLFKSSIKILLSNTISSRNIKFQVENASNYTKNSLPSNKEGKFGVIILTGEVPIKIDVVQNEVALQGTAPKETTKSYSLKYTIKTNDTALISDIIPTTNENLKFIKVDAEENISSQDQEEQKELEQQKLDQEVLSSQILDALSVQSALEIILRTIEVKSLNQAFAFTKDIQIGNKVFIYEIGKDSQKKFRQEIFSNGIYSDIIEQLLNPKRIDNGKYFTSDEEEALINAKYGFATTLLGSNSKNDDIFKEIENDYVDYQELLKAYVVPYSIDQDLIVGVKTNHPVYIPFGFLLMLLNHSSTIYDTKKSEEKEKSSKKSFQKPLVYIDYNPKLNFFLTNNKQLSTNPWVTLIPIEGTKGDYQELFDPEIVKNYKIVAIDGTPEQTQGSQATPLFNPETDDYLSYWLPKIKDGNSYRGKLMNILINIDYLTSIIKTYSFNDGSNNIYLKPFLEHILSDVNKYLGNFNAFRVSYNDMANTIQIVDDQLIITDKDEMLSPIIETLPQNRTEIPLVGLNSIAKSLEIKTEITNQLGNMIAISANSDIKEQAQLSTNAESLGFINVNYTDRYIPRRLAASDMKTATKNGEIVSAIQFNQSVNDFYRSTTPSYSDVSQMTSYYIEKMSKVKNRESGSRASSMIPVSVNISTDGLGGLSMGHAFTISDELLPYNYASKKASTGIDGNVNQVGFAIVGLSHAIDGNVWNTTIRANMVAVKDKSAFNWTVAQAKENDKAFTYNPSSIADYAGATPNADVLRNTLKKLGYTEKGNELSNAGDITQPMQQAASAFFTRLKQTYGKIEVEVTGGNDKYHKLEAPSSIHTTGNGIDFVITPATDENKAKVAKLLQEIQNSSNNFYSLNFLNEYVKRSEKATADHFHIFYDTSLV